MSAGTLFSVFFFFFFNDTATTEIYTLSLHDALPITCACESRGRYHSRREFPCGLTPYSARPGASTGSDLRHQPARLCELRREQQRVLERVTRRHRFTVVKQVAGEEQVGLGRAPTRQVFGAGPLDLECRYRLAQLHQRALLVAAQPWGKLIVAHGIEQQHARI